MDDDDLRDLFAAFAMISNAWVPPNIEDHAKNCYLIADAMIKAKYAELEGGIATIKKRIRKPKSE
jgi:hypothetical protein